MAYFLLNYTLHGKDSSDYQKLDNTIQETYKKSKKLLDTCWIIKHDDTYENFEKSISSFFSKEDDYFIVQINEQSCKYKHHKERIEDSFYGFMISM